MREQGDDAVHVELLLSDSLPAEVQSEVAASFAELGCTATVRLLPARRGLTGLEWMVLATVALDAFLHGLATKAGEDVYVCMRGLLERLARAPNHRRQGHLLVLRDPKTRLQIVLEDDLPRAAYEQLVGLDLSTLSHGPLHYDRSRARWRSELDEQRHT